MNLMEGELSGTPASPVVKIGSVSIGVPSVEGGALTEYLGKKVVVGLRPEDMEDSTTVDTAYPERTFSTTARLVESLGSEIIVHFGLDAEPYIVADVIDDEAETGLSTEFETATFVARVSPRSPVKNGSDIDLVIDSGRFHYFDMASGEAIR